MIGVVLMEEAPTSIALAEASNLVRFTGHQTRQVYHRQLPPQKPLNRNRRCFNQFDRKTDCFDGGSGDVAYSLGEFRRTARKANGREISKSEPAKTCRATFKTVCLTQTRHDGSVNKYQPDSLNTNLVVIGTKLVVGQKPGIVLADVKSSPTKGTDEEKETSTRNMVPMREKLQL